MCEFEYVCAFLKATPSGKRPKTSGPSFKRGSSRECKITASLGSEEREGEYLRRKCMNA